MSDKIHTFSDLLPLGTIVNDTTLMRHNLPGLPEQRPPLPFFTYYAASFLIIALAAALRPQIPSLAWRLAAVAALAALLLRALQHDAGDARQNYSAGCAWGGIFFTAVTLLLLLDPVREYRHETDTQPIAAMPWWKRVYYMVCVQANPRGVGWNYQFAQVTPIPKHTRLQFIASRAKRILWYAFLADVTDTYLDLNPIFAMTGAQARSLRSQGPLLACCNVVAHVSLTYCTINMSYDAFGLVCVASGLSKPKYWPVPFGKWRDSYTIRRFWGRTWHQMMRRFVSAFGKTAARFLGAAPGTWLSARIQLLVGFSASGLAHVPGNTAVAPHLTGASYWFFLYQAFAITLEDAVVAAGKRAGVRDGAVVRMVGYAWTLAWFACMTPCFVDWAIKAGAGDHRVFPRALVVEPALGLVAEVTGVDVLGRVAAYCAAR